MKGNILIVDDATDIRSLLVTVLRDNYQVTEAETGAKLKTPLPTRSRTWSCST